VTGVQTCALPIFATGDEMFASDTIAGSVSRTARDFVDRNLLDHPGVHVRAVIDHSAVWRPHRHARYFPELEDSLNAADCRQNTPPVRGHRQA